MYEIIYTPKMMDCLYGIKKKNQNQATGSTTQPIPPTSLHTSDYAEYKLIIFVLKTLP